MKIYWDFAGFCGNLLASGNGYTCKVSGVLDKLKVMFNKVDFSKDDENIHPPNICSRCHAAIGHFKQGSISTLTTPIVWNPHSPDCTVCIKLKRGGRPKKVRKQTGRPKSAESITVKDLMNWDPSKRLTPEILTKRCLKFYTWKWTKEVKMV